MNETTMTQTLGVIIAIAAGIKMGGVPKASREIVAEILFDSAQVIAGEIGLDLGSVLEEGEKTLCECLVDDEEEDEE